MCMTLPLSVDTDTDVTYEIFLNRLLQWPMNLSWSISDGRLQTSDLVTPTRLQCFTHSCETVHVT